MWCKLHSIQFYSSFSIVLTSHPTIHLPWTVGKPIFKNIFEHYSGTFDVFFFFFSFRSPFFCMEWFHFSQMHGLKGIFLHFLKYLLLSPDLELRILALVKVHMSKEVLGQKTLDLGGEVGE